MGRPRQHLPDLETESRAFIPHDALDAARWLLSAQRRDYLLRFCLVNLGSVAVAADAEETLQEFLLKSLSNVCRCFDPALGTSFWTYFCAALRNECWRQSKRLRRRAARREPFHDDLAVAISWSDDSGESEPDDEDLWNRMQRAGRDLDPRAWQAIQLRHRQGKSIEEVAKELGVSIQNAKVLLHRGRQQLAEFVRWESCSLLETDHVRDWRRLCEVLVADAQRSTVPGILWSHLDGPTQRRVRNLAVSTPSVATDDIAAMVSALNGLLRRADLWPKAVLASITKNSRLPAAASVLLKKRQLSSIATLRLNRLILEFALPETVVQSIPTISDHDAKP